ncbi:MAG TPA: hypothetical protein VNQ80_06050 [Parapedobacter sp.]|uniref:hypothetical protein n=1 Tax=Parapedobacter sp. TaxID=1958893 RepID=UPI002C894C1A|nr:hypothetical protein [Parapedobacter sp.]HWK56875.1 hypothetical protein [Parapedobacter sp.]
MTICSIINSEVGAALAQLDVQAVVVRCRNGRVRNTEQNPATGWAVSAGGLGFAPLHQRVAGTTNAAQPKHLGHLGALQVPCLRGMERKTPPLLVLG